MKYMPIDEIHRVLDRRMCCEQAERSLKLHLCDRMDEVLEKGSYRYLWGMLWQNKGKGHDLDYLARFFSLDLEALPIIGSNDGLILWVV